MADPLQLAHAVHRMLDEYIEVHNEVFTPSLWRTIRRALPIPGIFDAIPYDAHRNTLARLRTELATLLAEVARERASAPSHSPTATFLTNLEHYGRALAETLSRLQQISAGMADKANGAAGPSWVEYKQSLDEYERSRATQIQLGTQLNEALNVMRREA